MTVLQFENIQKRLDSIKKKIPGDNPFHDFIKSKSDWNVIPMRVHNPKDLEINDGIYDCLQRCLALALALELPVGEFTYQGSMTQVEASAARLALEHNATDELRHYEQFERAVEAYQVPEEYINHAKWFTRFISMNIYPHENPILISGFIELTVFFTTLSIMRLWGNPQLKLVVKYVSRDESTHVRTNYQIIDSQNILFSDYYRVNKLRLDMVSWLTEGLGDVEKDQSFWLNVSDNLMNTRKSDDLSFTRSAIEPAFFELPSY
jgi:hypothetical protein